MRLLIAVDGSDASLRCLKYVASLAAGKLDVEVRLVNVMEQPVYMGEFATPQVLEELEKAQQHTQQKILARAEAEAASLGLKTSLAAARGFPADEIVREAKTWKADQIVMGTRGMGAVKSLLVGSVAQHVVHQSELPVTLIR